MSEHMDFKMLICADLDNETTSEEKEILKEHLTHCAQCQRYYSELGKLSMTLNQWKDEELSFDLEKKMEKGSSGKRFFSQPRSFARYGVGGGVLVTVFLILFISKTITQVDTPQKEIIFPKTEQYEFLGTAKNTSDKDGVAALTREEKEPPIRFKSVADQNFTFASKEKAQEEMLNRRLDSEKTQGMPQRGRLNKDEGMSGSKSDLKKISMNENIADLSQRTEESRDLRTHEGKLQDVRRNIPAAQLVESTGARQSFPGVDAIQPGVVGGLVITPMESSKQGEYEETINLRQIIGYQESMNTEEYDRIYENGFLNVLDTPLSTFSIDVDTASYSNIRRYLNANQMPPVDSVRIEEMINYFTYEYPQPQEDELFSVTTDAAVCPWNSEHHLIRIGLQGKVMDANQLAPSNLVFLIDVSGSMNQPNKLPLLKQSLTMLVNHLTENERVAIVVYAGAAGIVLESTPGSAKDKILIAIETLQAGGSTAGGEGIQLAYSIAKENFIEKGNNRVILATDGDFNVGISSDSELIRLIEDEREKGIFLTILGFGTGNYKDNKMEKIADKGNGNYFYIDTENEARKVLSHELGSTLFTIAKDVKLQIEFNPAQIKAYRLIGYENRMLAKEDFNDDTKDAGELGPGHSVTALYEIIRTSSNEEINNVDPLIYQKKDAVVSSDLLTVKFRYKKVDENKSRLVQKSLSTDQITENPLKGFQFAAAVAEFGLLLRNSDFKADASYDSVIEGIENSLDNDKFGYRRELLGLVERAKQIDVRMVEPEINFKGK